MLFTRIVNSPRFTIIQANEKTGRNNTVTKGTRLAIRRLNLTRVPRNNNSKKTLRRIIDKLEGRANIIIIGRNDNHTLKTVSTSLKRTSRIITLLRSTINRIRTSMTTLRHLKRNPRITRDINKINKRIVLRRRLALIRRIRNKTSMRLHHPRRALVRNVNLRNLNLLLNRRQITKNVVNLTSNRTNLINSNTQLNKKNRRGLLGRNLFTRIMRQLHHNEVRRHTNIKRNEDLPATIIKLRVPNLDNVRTLNLRRKLKDSGTMVNFALVVHNRLNLNRIRISVLIRTLRVTINRLLKVLLKVTTNVTLNNNKSLTNSRTLTKSLHLVNRHLANSHGLVNRTLTDDDGLKRPDLMEANVLFNVRFSNSVLNNSELIGIRFRHMNRVTLVEVTELIRDNRVTVNLTGVRIGTLNTMLTSAKTDRRGTNRLVILARVVNGVPVNDVLTKTKNMCHTIELIVVIHHSINCRAVNRPLQVDTKNTRQNKGNYIDRCVFTTLSTANIRNVRVTSNHFNANGERHNQLTMNNRLKRARLTPPTPHDAITIPNDLIVITITNRVRTRTRMLDIRCFIRDVSTNREDINRTNNSITTRVISNRLFINVIVRNVNVVKRMRISRIRANNVNRILCRAIMAKISHGGNLTNTIIDQLDIKTSNGLIGNRRLTRIGTGLHVTREHNNNDLFNMRRHANILRVNRRTPLINIPTISIMLINNNALN